MYQQHIDQDSSEALSFIYMFRVAGHATLRKHIGKNYVTFLFHEVAEML